MLFVEINFFLLCLGICCRMVHDRASTRRGTARWPACCATSQTGSSDMICSTCSYRLGNLAVAIFGDFLTGFPFLMSKKNSTFRQNCVIFLDHWSKFFRCWYFWAVWKKYAIGIYMNLTHLTLFKKIKFFILVCFYLLCFVSQEYIFVILL